MKHTNTLQTYNERLFKVNSNNYLMLSAAVVAFVIIAGVVSSTANAQNSSFISSNGFPTNGTKTAATKQINKTVIVAAPGAVVKAGNKTAISTTPSSTTSNSPTNINRTGFANLYALTSPTGKSFPIKYTIKGGKFVGMLADKDRTTLVLVLDSGQKGGKHDY